MKGRKPPKVENKRNGDSHVSQSGTEVLVDVGFQDWVEVLEFDVANKCDYKYLVINRRKQNKETLYIIHYTAPHINGSRHFITCILDTNHGKITVPSHQ